MTTDELVEAIKTARSEGVTLPGGGTLHIGARSVRYALVDGLSHIIPKGNILVGIEVARLEYVSDNWRGHVEFLLLLQSYLVRVKGTLKEGERRALRFMYDLLPLSRLDDVVVTTAHEEHANHVYMRSAAVEIRCAGSEPIKLNATGPEDEIHELLQFGQHVLAARK